MPVLTSTPVKTTIRLAAALMLLASLPFPASGWVYPEHRDIALLAIQNLDPERRAVLDALWSQARAGHESRLCEVPADATQGEEPECIDYAAWPAIAGDHSCSAANLLHNVLETDWILRVADVAARLKNNIKAAGDARYKRINALRDSDIQLQGADPEYATRAGANNVHFLLARPTPEMDARTYLTLCMSNGCELNAIGAYAWYHLSALLKAGRLSREQLTETERAAVARAALADEAFALHFLEDVFASGHVAGTWGSASTRKGTHDYYNEHGLETRTWGGEGIVLVGDAWMGREDAERAAEVAQTSLSQVLDAARGVGPAAAITTSEPATLTPDSLNTCALEAMPDRTADPQIGPLLAEVLVQTPIPGLASGLGELPRFRSELGPFVGVAPAMRAATVGGGFGVGQTSVGGIGGLELSARVGLGLEGVINESGDGLVFLDVGFRQDASSTSTITGQPELEELGAVGAAIPDRATLSARIRMPFWLLPFDLLVAAPFLAFTAPEMLAGMAVQAGNGGLIPWQAGIATPIGRFQFVLGREFGVAFFGYTKGEDRVILPSRETAPTVNTLVGLRTIQFDFPVLEYRPFRTFSLDQSSSLIFQLYGGLDIPTRISVVAPRGNPEPELRTVWTFGLRMVFDWRYYF